MHIVLKVIAVTIMIAGFFLLDADFDQLLVEIGHWMAGRNLDRLASGGGGVALGCGVWAISMFIDRRGRSAEDKSPGEKS